MVDVNIADYVATEAPTNTMCDGECQYQHMKARAAELGCHVNGNSINTNLLFSRLQTFLKYSLNLSPSIVNWKGGAK